MARFRKYLKNLDETVEKEGKGEEEKGEGKGE